MKSRLNFYLFIMALITLDAVLIRSPNLLGKIGLWIYKYHYLRTFPKALLTVFLVVGVATVFSEAIRYAVKKELLKNRAGKVLFFLLTALSVALAIKVGIDFSSGSYEHTGLRFRSGAYLLPIILVVVFVYGWLTLPKIPLPFPESPVINEDTKSSIK
jgi:hypothetical protein